MRTILFGKGFKTIHFSKTHRSVGVPDAKKIGHIEKPNHKDVTSMAPAIGQNAHGNANAMSAGSFRAVGGNMKGGSFLAVGSSLSSGGGKGKKKKSKYAFF
jgi:hypothetical protein